MRVLVRVFAALVFVAFVAVVPVAFAQEAPPADAPPSQPAPAEPEVEVSPSVRADVEAGRLSPPRALPDYDGRGDEPTTAGDVLLWVPRILFSPLYLVSEFVLRRPIGALVVAVEEEDLTAKLFDIFTFGPNGNIAVVPTALIDLGFQPSVGLYFRWNEFLAPANKLRLHTAFWGPHWLRATIADRIEPEGGNYRVTVRGEFTHRPDGLYYGIGLDHDNSNFSRYSWNLFEGQIAFEADPWRASQVQAFTRIRHRDFGQEVCCEDPSIEQRIANGTLTDRNGDPMGLPPGHEGYTVFQEGIVAAIDTRSGAAASGVRATIDAEYSFDVNDPLARRWFRYGGALATYLNLGDSGRVIKLEAYAAMVDSVRGDVPFTEMIDLGDTGPMRAFILGRLIGQSGAAATFEYRWPIWVWLNGTLHASFGNVFGYDFTDFDFDSMRLSTGLGVRTIDAKDHGLQLTVAIGTEPFDRGANIECVRFVFGGDRLF